MHQPYGQLTNRGPRSTHGSVIVLPGYAEASRGESTLGPEARAAGWITSHMEWRSGATWVLSWLCGLALISYLGAYGDGLGVIGFGAAFPVIGVFSLIIFMLAVRVRLVPERAAEHVEHSRAEADGEEHELDGAAT